MSEGQTIANGASVEEAFDFLDTALGIENCGDMEDFYIEVIETYIDEPELDNIRTFFDAKDWNNYRISAHTIKSSSLTIGAVEMSEQAKEMEYAVKEDNIPLILEKHSQFVINYETMINRLSKALGR